MTQKTVAGRDKSLDALKLFAIFLVLLGHCIQHLLTSEPWSEPMYRAIYSFHMPLFMLLVGYFAKGLLGLSLKEVILKKFQQLLLPAISFSLLSISANIANDILHLDLHAGDYVWKLLSNFWFLRSAFCCCILFYVFSLPKRFRYISLLISVVIVQLALRLVPNEYNVFTFNLSRMYPCFLAGFFMAEKKEMLTRHAVMVTIVALSVYCLMFQGWSDLAWQSYSQWGSLYYQIIIGLAGSLVVFMTFTSCAKYLPSTAAGHFLCDLGKYTLGVYLLQYYILERGLRALLNCDGLDFAVFNFVVAPLMATAVLCICIVLIKFILRNSTLAFLLLGRSKPQSAKPVNINYLDVKA